MCLAAAAAMLLAISAAPGFAQATPPSIESVTLEEAVQRALKNNPTVAQAAAGILRAESLLQQARALTLPSVNASLTNVVVKRMHAIKLK
jgi:outer membrane protein TolC